MPSLGRVIALAAKAHGRQVDKASAREKDHERIENYQYAMQFL